MVIVNLTCIDGMVFTVGFGFSQLLLVISLIYQGRVSFSQLAQRCFSKTACHWLEVGLGFGQLI